VPEPMAKTGTGSSAQDPERVKAERDRFIKPAFCRADLLFELDRDLTIVYGAGATDLLFGVSPDDLPGTSFVALLDEKFRPKVKEMLSQGADGGDGGGDGGGGRIEDAILKIKGPNGVGVVSTLAGYRISDFGDHYFLALKVGPASPVQVAEREPVAVTEAGLLAGPSFGQEAAARLRSHADAGHAARVTMVHIENLEQAAKALDANERLGLMTAVGEVLKAHSIGGNTAGQLDEESFGYAHDEAVDPETVNIEVEERALRHLPEGAKVGARSLTMEADDAGMTEEQVAKALVYTMDQFCSGEGRVTTRKLSESLDELMNGTVETVRYIKTVTESGDFDLVYMPICDLRVGRVHHFEALSRFRDTERAKSTFQIITLAENLNLIAEFDRAVFDKSAALLDEFAKKGPMPAVAINLSGLSLSNDAFVDGLLKSLKAKPSLKGRLLFELTESAGIGQLEKTNNIIQGFRHMGYGFALDDFGAGAASFDYLNALEVDVVKFDGPVIRRACASKRGGDLLTTMAKMCASSGVETVAEMVEDKNIANQVFYCGIDFGQGWYFGKPSPDPFAFAADFADETDDTE